MSKKLFNNHWWLKPSSSSLSSIFDWCWWWWLWWRNCCCCCYYFSLLNNKINSNHHHNNHNKLIIHYRTETNLKKSSSLKSSLNDGHYHFSRTLMILLFILTMCFSNFLSSSSSSFLSVNLVMASSESSASSSSSSSSSSGLYKISNINHNQDTSTQLPLPLSSSLSPPNLSKQSSMINNDHRFGHQLISSLSSSSKSISENTNINNNIDCNKSIQLTSLSSSSNGQQSLSSSSSSSISTINDHHHNMIEYKMSNIHHVHYNMPIISVSSSNNNNNNIIKPLNSISKTNRSFNKHNKMPNNDNNIYNDDDNNNNNNDEDDNVDNNNNNNNNVVIVNKRNRINTNSNNLKQQQQHFQIRSNESNRKQKRESRQFFINKSNGNNNPYWNHAVTNKMLRRRSRRLTHLYSSSSSLSSSPSKLSSSTSSFNINHLTPSLPSYSQSSSSSLPSATSLMIIKSKPPKMASLSSLYSTNGNSYYPLHTSSNAVSGQQNRLKILLNPPPAGFGANLVPNKKCNYEIYPSGCFDENGSLCDNDGMCICRPGYLIQIANLYCLRPSFIGEACYTTEQCERKVNNSGCFNYREEYREENPSAFFGPSQSSWPMGECRCRIGHRFDERLNACVRSIIGSWCSNVWDCEMADEDLEHIESGGHRSNRTGGYTHQSHIHSLSSSSSSSITTSHSALASTSRNKIANLVCENNICNCSQFFYYNKTAEECQYVETYGHLCQTFATITNEINSANIINDKNSYYINPSKRSIRFRNRRVRQLVTKSLQQQQQQQSEQQQQHEQQHEQHEQLTSTTNPIYNENQLNLDNNNRRQYHHIDRSIRSLLRDKFVDYFDGSSSSSSLSSFECNYPTICSTNKTCICADGYEHQPTMIPQCQRIGAHYTHYFHSGSSIRSMKGPDGFPHDRSSYHEGSSNVANFFEYVLYFLVPGLIIIFIFKPCFRRIGAWRNHIHQYQSDSDFYLATTANGRPVIAEMSVLPPCSATGTGVVNAAVAAAGGVNTSEKPNILAGNTATTMPTVGDVYSNEFASFAAFAPHLVCHNAYLFDSTDPCYATPISSYGCHPPTIPPTVPNNQQQQAASMALVREKLQTIEESQSEDGSTQMNNFSNSNSMNNQSLIAESCVDCVTTATTTTNNNNIVDQQLKANGDQSNIQNQSGNIYQDYRKNDDDNNNNNNNDSNKTTNIIDIIVDKSNRCDSNIIDNNNDNNNIYNNNKNLNILQFGDDDNNNKSNDGDHDDKTKNVDCNIDDDDNNDHHLSTNHIAEST